MEQERTNHLEENVILLSEKESTRKGRDQRVMGGHGLWGALFHERQSRDLGIFQTGRFYYLDSTRLHHKLMDANRNSLLGSGNPAGGDAEPPSERRCRKCHLLLKHLNPHPGNSGIQYLLCLLLHRLSPRIILGFWPLKKISGSNPVF